MPAPAAVRIAPETPVECLLMRMHRPDQHSEHTALQQRLRLLGRRVACVGRKDCLLDLDLVLAYPNWTGAHRSAALEREC